jgi:hypothetical protein
LGGQPVKRSERIGTDLDRYKPLAL